ncbi:MAG: hypothetical protein HJJLKODD_01835 [Phycisphaerae bacterium]|nr:hypothetical protein [Phycisphaerae bacterium]
MVKKHVCKTGAPDWVLTYGDMMSLLLCFFILLAAMSELRTDDEKFQKVVESLRMAFGYKGGMGEIPSDLPPVNSLIKKLMEIVIPEDIKTIGESPDKGLQGRTYRVTSVREGLKVTFGGRLLFERFSDQLLPGGEEVLKEFSVDAVGLRNMINVLGHTTPEDLPRDCGFTDKDELAFARAKMVRDLLVQQGIEPDRIRIGSVADREPLVRQAYTEEAQVLNRTVEIVVNESLSSEYQGEVSGKD